MQDTQYGERTDKELVQLCLEKDSLAWEAILFRYKKKIFNISYQFVGRMDEAEDLSQEIFFKVFHSLEKFNLDANFQYWIIRVAKNYCIDYYRKKRKEREAMVDNMEQIINVLKSVSTPHLVLEEKEKMDAIRNSINNLPEILRSCILLRNLYGYSYQDIARILNIPEGTVKSRINRGRLELSKMLDVYFRVRQHGDSKTDDQDDD